MGLYYDIQNSDVILGSKTSAGVITGATLTARYDFDGTTSKSFEVGLMSKVELNCSYKAGTGETSNSVQIIPEGSPDGVNWFRFVNESTSNGTSTLSQREFTITQTTGYGTLAYDAQSANFVAGLVLTGGTSSATAIIESDSDSGTTGVLTLSNISGIFQNDETITASTGSATVNGVLTSITNFTLPLDISTKYLRVSAKETGVASNFGTLFVEAIVSGK